MTLFKTARFFFTLDLDVRGEGEDVGETETLIISLEIHFTYFLRSHS